MRTREFNPKTDAAAVDKLTKDNQYGIDLSRDTVTLVESSGLLIDHSVLLGLSAGHPVVFVHHFIFDAGLATPQAAEALLAYSLGLMRGRQEKRLVFGVSRDNESMQMFMKSHGAVELPDGKYYEMEIK